MKFPLNEIKKKFINSDFNWINDYYLNLVLKKIPGEWCFVGGIVRDSLLGYKTKDIDIVTLSNSDQIENALQDFTLSLVGKRFGTIGVFIKNWKIEITTARVDFDQDGRHTNVKFSKSFKEDCIRRDFTINALLIDQNYNLIDYINGLEDLKNNITIKFIGNANQRIEEDYLRILRYIRFFYRFHNENELIPNTYKEIIINNLNGLKNISQERLFMELENICTKKTAENAIKSINELKIWKTVFDFDLNINNFKKALDWTEQQVLLLQNAKNLNNIKSLSKNVKYLWKMINKFYNQKDNNQNLLIIQSAKIYKRTKNISFLLFFARIFNLNFSHITQEQLNNKNYNILDYDIGQRSKIEIFMLYKYLSMQKNININDILKLI